MSSRGVGETLHFEKTNLIQATSENVDNMTVVGNTLGEAVVKLGKLAVLSCFLIVCLSYLEGLLVVLDVVAVNIVMGSDGFPEFRTNNHARSLGRRTTTE